MRRSFSFIASTLAFAAFVAITLSPGIGRAQGQSDQLHLPGYKPLPPPPITPYKPVAVTLPAPNSEAGFVAFRKQLADAVAGKDRAALAKLVVAQGFFWMREPGKNLADKTKPGIDDLDRAIDLTGKDGAGWDILQGYAAELTAAPLLPDHPGVICAPAPPKIDGQAFRALLESTQTEPLEWAYPAAEGVEVRSAPKPNAPVVDKLGMDLVHVVSESEPAEKGGEQPFLEVALPSGKTGYVPAEALSGFGSDELCYVKNAGGWKIAGFLGGVGE
jgi:hypothetical protein